MGVDSVSPQPQPMSMQSLYFQAAQSAGQQAAKARKGERAQGTRRSFADTLRKSREEAELVADGLPPEIAGMDEESAVVFLKDAADVAGDALKENQSAENIAAYRTKIGQFLKYIERNNFEVLEKRRFGRNRRGRPLPPYHQIRVINQKLDSLATDMLYNHSRNLDILARLEELNGLIIDLLAG